MGSHHSLAKGSGHFPAKREGAEIIHVSPLPLNPKGTPGLGWETQGGKKVTQVESTSKKIQSMGILRPFPC